MTDVSTLSDQYELQLKLVDDISAPADAVKARLDAMEVSAKRAAEAIGQASGATADAGAKIEVVDAAWDRLARRNDAVTAAAARLANAQALLADAQEAAARAMAEHATDQETVDRTMQKLSDNVAIQKARLVEVREATEAATVSENAWRGAHEQTVTAIAAAQQSGSMSAQQAAAALDAETVAYARNIEASSRASQAVEHHGLSTQQTTFIMRQFAREGVSTFAELAAGGAVIPALTGAFVSLAQEMTLSRHGFHLVVEAVQEFAAAVGGWGVVAATAGVAAFGAALVGLGYYAETAAREEAKWRAELSLTRTDYEDMAEAIESSAKRIAHNTNESFEQATVAVLAFSKVPGVTKEQAESLAASMEGLSRSMGVDLPAATKLAVSALVDPAKALAQMASQDAPMRALDVTSLAVGLHLAQMGDRAGASRIAIAALQEQSAIAAGQTTKLQDSIKALGEAFHATDENGQSFARLIGSFSTEVASAAIDALKDTILEFKQIYDLLVNWKWPDHGSSFKAPESQAAISGILNTAAGNYGLDPEYLKRVQGSEGVFQDGQWVTSSAGAIGSMQVKPDTFAGMLRDPRSYPRVGAGTDLTDPETNVDAGAAFLAHCLRKYSDPYLALLAYHDGETVIDEMIASKGQSGGPSAAALAQARKALSGYKGEGVAMQSMTIRPDEELPIPPMPPEGGEAGLLDARRGVLTAQGIDSTADRIDKLKAKIKEVGGAEKELSDAYGPVSPQQQETIENYRGKLALLNQQLKEAEAPQAEQVRGLNNEAAATRLVGAASQELLRARQAIQEHDLKNPDAPYSEAQKNEILAATQNKLSAGYDELLGKTQRDTAQINQKTDAYDRGANALRNMSNHQIAYNATLAFAEKDSPLHKKMTEELTKALDDQTQAQIRNNDAVNPANQNQITYLKAEIATLGMASDARTLYLAHLQAEQQAKIEGAEKGQAYIQHLIEEKDQIAQLTLAYQQQQSAMNYLGSQFSQAFDQISQAMTNAFLSGEGKAVNWGNVMKSVVQQVIAAFLRLSVINPIINSITGQSTTQNPTLSSVVSALNSGGGGGSASSNSGGGSPILNLLGTGSSLSSALGGPSIGSLFGLSGSNGGLLSSLGLGNIGSGISSSIQSALGYELISGPLTQGASQASMLAANSIAGAGYQGAGLTVGGAASSVGGGLAGFGIGSTVGGMAQRALDKTGPGPQIGAGIGAAIGSIFGPVPGMIGGTLGGLVGSLFGPHPQSSYSGAYVGIDSGQFTKGQMVFQKDPNAGAEDAALYQAVTTLNGIMKTAGLQVTGQSRVVQIGDNSNRSGPDPNKYADLATANFTGRTAFSAYGFGSSSDANLNEKIGSKAFATADEFASWVKAYTDAQAAFKAAMATVGQYMEDLGKTSGSLNDGLVKLNDAFASDQAAMDALRATGMLSADQMDQLATAESNLQDARDKSIRDLYDQVNAHLNGIDQGLQSRTLNAQAAISGSPADAEAAKLYAFDLNIQPQRDALKADMVALFGDAMVGTEAYTARMALLETTLGKERLAIVTDYNKQIIAATQHYTDTSNSLWVRLANASATISGSAADAQYAKLLAFDVSADQERAALRADLIKTWGEAIVGTEGYNAQIALLETVLGKERVAIVTDTNRQIAAQQNQAAQTAAGTVASMAQWVNQLKTSTSSPLSPMDKLAAAQASFANDNTAARAGSYTALQALTNEATSLLQMGQAVYGSGASYVDIFKGVLDTLNTVVEMGPDTLTNIVFTAQTEEQTQTLVDALADLGTKLTLIRLQLQQGGGTPGQLVA